MQKQPPSVQDSFLNTLRREQIKVTIYLVNGTKLIGRIKNFDRFAIIFENGVGEQMVFKHAVSTIISGRQPEKQKNSTNSDEYTDSNS